MTDVASSDLLIIYFARIHPLNLAGNRKVLAIKTSLSLISSRCLLVNTGVLFIRCRSSKNKLIRFLSLPSLCLDLLFTTVSTLLLLISKIFSKRSANILFVFYNLMPDTSLPGILLVCLSRIFPLIKISTLLEVEENIMTDSVASVWRFYSRIISSCFRFDHVLTVTQHAAEGIKSRSPFIVYPGVFASEATNDRMLLEKKQKNFIDFLFSSRIDSQRGMIEFLDIIQSLPLDCIRKLSDLKIRFVICGYGSLDNLQDARNRIDKIQSKCPNVDFIVNAIGCSTSTYSRYFKTSRCCISVVKNPVFAASSFPSKVFDALCEGKVILSYGNVDFSAIESEHIHAHQFLTRRTFLDAVIAISQNINYLTMISSQYSVDFQRKFSVESLASELKARLTTK